MLMQYRSGGRVPPMLDCYGLYRLIVQERAGVTVPLYESASGMVTPKTIIREMRTDRWQEIEVGQERELDMVLLWGIAGLTNPRRARIVPMHCGCVVKPGFMLDIEDAGGVRLRVYRDIFGERAHSWVKSRVLGIFRPAALAEVFA